MHWKLWYGSQVSLKGLNITIRCVLLKTEKISKSQIESNQILICIAIKCYPNTALNKYYLIGYSAQNILYSAHNTSLHYFPLHLIKIYFLCKFLFFIRTSKLWINSEIYSLSSNKHWLWFYFFLNNQTFTVFYASNNLRTKRTLKMVEYIV